jgi:ribosomal protein L11 methyltransferase
MAAIRLGARSAIGIDNDPVAIECAREYAAVNRFGPELDLRVATLAAIGTVPADVILANLDRKTLLESARSFAPFLKRGARLFLSGILPDDRPDMASAFADAGASVAESRERDGWLALEFIIAEPCEGASG